MQRALFRTFRDFFETSRRQVRLLLASPSLAFAHIRFRRALMRRDWLGLRAMLRPMAAAARKVNDPRVLSELGYAALRLDEPQLGSELLYASRSVAGKIEPTDWRGESIDDATLIVRVMEVANQGLAGGMAQVGRIAAAAEKAARTVIIVEPRMVSLFARSLPGVTVIPFGADLAAFKIGRFVTANANDLEVVLDYDAAAIARTFCPLVAEPLQTRALREKYLRGRALPLIGISWWSSHYGKDLPALTHWSRLIKEVPAQFVSLQYGDVEGDIAALNENDLGRLMTDPTVDQMSDMDRFASQIAALDLVVSISNSGAHLAGGLGQRMILVRDDLFRRNWPYLSRSVPWYPQTVVIGRDGRPWEVAFDEIVATARRS